MNHFYLSMLIRKSQKVKILVWLSATNEFRKYCQIHICQQRAVRISRQSHRSRLTFISINCILLISWFNSNSSCQIKLKSCLLPIEKIWWNTARCKKFQMLLVIFYFNLLGKQTRNLNSSLLFKTERRLCLPKRGN